LHRNPGFQRITLNVLTESLGGSNEKLSDET